MPELFIDHLSNLTCREERGVIRALTRKARVKFTPVEIALYRNQNVLNLALDFLTAQGLSAMSVLGVGKNPMQDMGQRFASLVLTKRTPSLAENDPCYVDVMLEYEHIMDGHNQTIKDPPLFWSTIYGKGKTSIREKSTNFFYPEGDRTNFERTQIVVAHQYPTTETGIPASAYSKEFPRVVFQGGEIKIPFPESTYSIAGIVFTKKPAKVAKRVVACINKIEWQGNPPFTWICSECQWEVNNPAFSGTVDSTYKMSFEFQHNEDGWNPDVVFLDQRFGGPPASVVEARDNDDQGVMRLTNIPVATAGGNVEFKQIPAGLWKVPALRRLDFDAYFGVLFDGLVPQGGGD